MGRLQTFNKLLIKKTSLLKCIFTTLILQTLLTTIAFNHIYTNPKKYEELYKKESSIFYSLLFLVVSVTLVVAMVYMNISFNTRVLLFTIFSILEGVFLGSILRYVPREIIMSALVSTITIFSTFLAAGGLIVSMGIDITWMGIYLLFGLLGLIIYNIVSAFIKPSDGMSKSMTVFGIMLFSVYILFDTNNILLKYNNTGVDCILGALNYYLDIINIFIQSIDYKSS